MADPMDPQTKTALTIGGVVVAAVGAVVIGRKVWDHFHPDTDDEVEGGGAATVAEDIEAIYALPGAYSIDLGGLPVLRPRIGNTAGSTAWFVMDGEAPYSLTAYLDSIEASAKAAGNALVPPALVDSDQMLLSLAAALEHDDDSLFGPEEDAADVWAIVLGPTQVHLTIAAVKAALAKIRAVIGAHRRIVWLLSKSTPPGYAKALNEAHEEWYRATSDDAPQAATAWAVLTAPSPQALSVIAEKANPV